MDLEILSIPLLRCETRALVFDQYGTRPRYARRPDADLTPFVSGRAAPVRQLMAPDAFRELDATRSARGHALLRDQAPARR